MPQRSTPTVTVTAREFHAAPWPKRKPTRKPFTGCWQLSAAAILSGRRRNLIPARSTARHRRIDAMRLLSVAVLVITWWTASLYVGNTRLPPPPEVLEAMLTEAKSGALLINLGAHLPRAVLPFFLALTLAPAI